MKTQRMIPLAVLCLFSFVLLFVSREFGVADNGDFLRYMAFVDKPVGFTVNWPKEESPDFERRFFIAPHSYWVPSAHRYGDYWKSSMIYLWELGGIANRCLFSDKVVNIRYLGLPLFLLQFAVMFFLYRQFEDTPKPRIWIALALLFAVFSDGAFTAFFNSFYPQSCTFVVLPIVFAGLLSLAYSDKIDRKTAAAVMIAIVVAMVFAAAAKQQYLYFLPIVPVLLLVCFPVLKRDFGINLKTVGLIAALALLVCGLLFAERFFAADFKMEHNTWGNEKYSTYKFYAHFLYRGILPRTSDPRAAMKKLDLPADTVRFVGKTGFDSGFNEALLWNWHIPRKTVIKTFFAYPGACLKLFWHNLGAFGMMPPMQGMIPSSPIHGFPPLPISMASALASSCAGRVWFFFDLLLGILLMSVDFGWTKRAFAFNRILAGLLMTIAVFEVCASMGDGDLDSAKHMLCGSFVGLLLPVQFVFALIWRLSPAKEKSAPVTGEP